jgi:tetratricopeptide (TPR) repeat protein
MAPPLRPTVLLALIGGALLAASASLAQQQVQWPEHPSRDEAVLLAQQAGAALQAKDWVRAAETSQRLAVICREELPDQPAYEAMAQNYLGIAHAWLGDHQAGLAAMVRSAELYEQALPADSPHLQTVFDSGRDAAFAAEDWDMAWHFEEKMNGLFEQLAVAEVVDARLWESAERWAGTRQARPALELARRRAQRIADRVGADHPDAIAAAQRVAYIAVQVDEHQAAVEVLTPLVPRARALTDAHAGLRMAVLNELGEALRALARWQEAAPLYDEAFAGLENDSADDWDGLATLHNNRGLNRKALGDLEGAADDLTRAIFFRRQQAADDASLAYPLNNRGNLYREMGLLDAAERDLWQAYHLRHDHDGDTAVTTATTILNLGIVAFMRMDHIAAERRFVGAHQRYLLVLGPEHPKTANAMMNLARLRQVRGEVDKANELYLTYVKPVVDKLPPGHAYRTSYQTFVVDLFAEAGDYKEARRWAERALKEMIEVRGDSSLDVATSTYQLAVLDWAGGDKRKARVRMTRALEVMRRAGIDNPGFRAQMQIDQARWDLDEKKVGRARRRLEEALAAAASVEGHEVLLADAEMYLAVARMLEGEHDHALEHLTRAKAHVDDSTARWMVSGSLSDRQRFSTRYLHLMDVLLGVLHDRPTQPGASQLMAELRTAFRGMAVAASAQRFQQVRRSPQARSYLVEIAALRRRLSSIALGEENVTDEERYLLQQQLESFERSLATLHSGGSFDVRPPRLQDVRKALPPGGRYVDYMVLAHDNKPDMLWALSFGATGDVDFRSLGEADVVFEQASDLRRLAGDPAARPAAIKKLGRRLHRALLPAEVAGAGGGPLVIAPHQTLNVMPWSALVDDEDRWLAAARPIVLTLGARELLEQPPVASSAPLIVAAPAYGEAGEGVARQWAPLPGTLREANTLSALMPQARVLTGAAASEQAMSAVRGPRVLHIATHGYFFAPKDKVLDEGARLASARGFKLLSKPRPSTSSALPAGAQPPGRPGLDGDAMVRSGLVLAGANEQATENDDGLLTGLEASGLDLGGTQLVVLSACETGLGDVEPGFGVDGLRRAFAIAGARSQAMSLWSVDDEATRQLMERFYAALIRQGAPRGEALRRAQQKVMQTAGYEHPYYWAAFILSGDWRPLTPPADR